MNIRTKKIITGIILIIFLCSILFSLKLYIPENSINFKSLKNFISLTRQRIQYASFGDDWDCVEGEGLKYAFCKSTTAGPNYPYYTGFGYNVPTKKIDMPMEAYPSLNFCKKRMKFLAEKSRRNWWSKPYGCLIWTDEKTSKRVYLKKE